MRKKKKGATYHRWWFQGRSWLPRVKHWPRWTETRTWVERTKEDRRDKLTDLIAVVEGTVWTRTKIGRVIQFRITMPLLYVDHPPDAVFWHWAKVFLLSAVLYLALSLLCERSSVQMKGSIFRKVTGRNPFGLFGHFGWTVLILYLIFSTQLKAFYNYHSLGLCFT